VSRLPAVLGGRPGPPPEHCGPNGVPSGRLRRGGTHRLSAATVRWSGGTVQRRATVSSPEKGSTATLVRSKSCGEGRERLGQPQLSETSVDGGSHREAVDVVALSHQNWRGGCFPLPGSGGGVAGEGGRRGVCSGVDEKAWRRGGGGVRRCAALLWAWRPCGVGDKELGGGGAAAA
jgi:hypothetical protein